MAHLETATVKPQDLTRQNIGINKAVEKGETDPRYKLYLAQMLQINGKYDEAAKWYAKYKEEVLEDRRSSNEMKACSDYGQFYYQEIDTR